MEVFNKVKKKYSKQTIVLSILLYVGLAIIALVCILPMWHVLMASFSDPLEFGGYEGFLFVPINWKITRFWQASYDSYRLLFTHEYLWTGYFNTILYTFSSVALGLVISIAAAYALSRKQMILKRPLLLFILVSMFFSGGMVPFYIVVNNLGMINTRWALILPTCCNAMNIIMLRTGILAIPDALFEAAELDGAGAVRIMIKIVIPLSLPFIVVVALFNGVAQWNSWVNASMFLRQDFVELYPLQLILNDILSGSLDSVPISPDDGFLEMYIEGIRMAAIIVASLPLIMVYPFLQKHFEKGVIIGGVKG